MAFPTIKFNSNGQFNQGNIVGQSAGLPMLVNNDILGFNKDDLLTLFGLVQTIEGTQIDINTSGPTSIQL